MAKQQIRIATDNGCAAIGVAPGIAGDGTVSGVLNPHALAGLHGFDLVLCQAADEVLKDMRVALAGRSGKLIALCAEDDMAARCRIERHICIDTTAAGGNASLLADVS